MFVGAPSVLRKSCCCDSIVILLTVTDLPCPPRRVFATSSLACLASA
jgi:hypothetical protein